MEIYYIHKNTGAKVALQDLKDKKTLYFCFAKYSKDTAEVSKIEYKATEIPLSDDFKIECVNTDFTTDELEQILWSLHSNDFKYSQLFNKVQIMWREKRILERS